MEWKQFPTIRIFPNPQNVSDDYLAVLAIREDGEAFQEVGTFRFNDDADRNRVECLLRRELEKNLV